MKIGWLFVASSVAVLSACSGASSPLTPSSSAILPESVAATAAKLTVTPKNLSVASGSSGRVVVAEKKYRGAFTIASTGAATCQSIASWSPAKGKGPSLALTVTGLRVGTCLISFADTAKHKANLKVTVTSAPAVDVVYTVDSGTNSISQLGFGADGSVTQIAPNYPLPSSCSGATAIALAPAQSMAFVACRSASGEVLPLVVNSAHALTSSPIAPVPVGYASALIAPASGVPGSLYVSGSGGLVAYHFTATSLAPIATYATAVSPTQLAYYVNSHGALTLFAAASDYAQCSAGGFNGAVEPWLQASDGSLTEETLIPTCAAVGNVAVANGDLFWAGSSAWGAYSIASKLPLNMPAPPWPAGDGPAYTDAMSPVVVQSAPTGPATAFAIGAANGSIYLNIKGSGAALTTYTLAAAAPDIAKCRQFNPPLASKGKNYPYVCFAIVGTGLEMIGESGGAATVLGTYPALTGPADLAVAAPGEFK